MLLYEKITSLRKYSSGIYLIVFAKVKYRIHSIRIDLIENNIHSFRLAIQAVLQGKLTGGPRRHVPFLCSNI